MWQHSAPFIHNLVRKEKAVSWWQDGYDKGHEDGVEDRHSIVDSGPLGALIDAVLPTTDAEEEWRSGYQEGYEAGKREREENN